MEHIKAKIAKLMAFGNDGRGNDFEQEAALRQAEALMRKHNIDVAEIADRTGVKPIYTWSSIVIPMSKRKATSTQRWFGMLLTCIGKFTDCKVSWFLHDEHGMCGKFQGDAEDTAYAGWLTKHLRDHCVAESLACGFTTAERDSFRKAYAIAIGYRIEALLTERKAALQAAVTSSGTALMVVNAKLALRDEEFGKQTYAKASRFTMRAGAADAGRSAAGRASLNRPSGSTSHTAIGA